MEKLRPKTYEEFMSAFKVDVPDNFNYAFDVVDKKDPDELAMVHVDPDGIRKEYTFGFFAKESAKLASGLKKMGIKKGDRVMLILYRRVEYWISMMALHKLGAIPIPSPSLLTPHDIEFRVNFAKVKAFIAEYTVADNIEEARPKCPSMDVLVQVDGEDLPEGWTRWEDVITSGDEEYPRPADAPGGKDPMIVFFSSGTTGQPKMVSHDHTYPLGHFTTGVYWHDLEPGDLHLTVSDTGWGKSVWGKLYGQWMAGAVIFVWDFRGRFVPAELLEKVAEHKITTFCAPPTIFRFLIREDLSKYDLSNLRHCTTAGELLNHSVFEAWKEATGLPLYEGYGQTETCLQLATFPFMEPKPGSIGKPAPGWDISILDEEGKPVTPGEEGEICIRIDNGDVLGLFTDYLDEPEKTAKVKVDGFYHTGDKAWVDEDGYFWFVGRTDDLIKSSGYRIGPFEVESALVSHPAVVESAVTGLPDPVRGMAVKATIVLAEEYTPSEELTKELQDHVKKVTAPYKYPRVIAYVDELPKTISGKIKRAEIRERDLEQMNKN